jgi:hypothetical protein
MRRGEEVGVGTKKKEKQERKEDEELLFLYNLYFSYPLLQGNLLLMNCIRTD